MVRAWPLFLVLLCIHACSQPERRKRDRKRERDLSFELASNDRSNPRSLTVDADGEWGKARGHAPAAGVWWYALDFPELADATASRVTITARHVARTLSPPPNRVTMSVVVNDQEHHPTSGPLSSKVDVGELPEPIPRLLLRITTTGKADFTIFAHRVSRFPEPVRYPPCDIDHIDPSNPNCRGWHPRCDLNNPDFRNPNCCQADCGFGALTCRAQLISLDASGARISLGANKQIMRYATGRLYERGKPVSDILVLQVEERESFIMIMSPKRITDPSKLLATGEVVLTAPNECRKR